MKFIYKEILFKCIFQSEVVVEQTFEKIKWKSFVKKFPDNECRFAIFDLVLKVEDELTEYKGNKVRK